MIPKSIQKCESDDKLAYIALLKKIDRMMRRYKCVIRDGCTDNIKPISLYTGYLTMCDVRNYLPVCSAHRYKNDTTFDPFKFVRDHAPDVYCTLRYLNKKTRVNIADSVMWGHQVIGDMYMNDKFTDYINNLYDFEWDLRSLIKKLRAVNNA